MSFDTMTDAESPKKRDHDVRKSGTSQTSKKQFMYHRTSILIIGYHEDYYLSTIS